MDDDTDNDYLGQHRLQDSLPAGPDQGCDGKEAKDEDTDNDYTIDTIDTDNDYTIDDTATAHFLFLIPPHKPSAPTQAGAHVENAENAQEEEARNPLPIDDRKDTLAVTRVCDRPTIFGIVFCRWDCIYLFQLNVRASARTSASPTCSYPNKSST